MNSAPPQTEIASFGLVIRTTHTHTKKKKLLGQPIASLNPSDTTAVCGWTSTKTKLPVLSGREGRLYFHHCKSERH